MATLRELIIKISANSQSFQTEISRASRMGQDYYRTMQNGGRQAAAAARESERALSDLTAGFASAGRAAAAATAAFATGKIVQIADEWNSVNARLKQASSSADDFAASQRQLMEISQRTGTAFSDNANLFSRAAASMREYGYSSDEVLKITEAVSTGLKLSGANTQEASSVITQFSQVLAQGVLRGEEFNAVNEAGDRVIRALAAGMGVARKDLKSMADQGQLTIDKVVPALMSQLGSLQGEFASMPQTVSGSLQKVTNSFMAWVGGVNLATGATDALSGGLDGVAQTLDSFTSSAVSGALSDVADNMSTITTVAGALVGVGLARYLSGVVTSATSATGALISAAKSEVALAVAQDKAAQSAVAASRAEVYRAQQAVQRSRSADVQAAQQEKIAAAEAKVTAAQARLTTALATGTATEKVRARTVLERAQAGLVAAKNADAQAVAERRLAAAQAALNRNISNRVSTQSNLNSVTSVGTRLMSGALGLIGGVPGLVMLGAGAWYAMYQNQEQARQSAIQYASTLDGVVEKAKEMSEIQLRGSISDSGASIDALKDKLEDLRAKQDEAAASIAEYTKLARQLGVEHDQNNGYVRNAAKAQREYNQISRDIADTTAQLNKVVDSQNKLQDELANKVSVSGAAFRKIQQDIQNAINVNDAMAASMSVTIQFMDEMRKKSGGVTGQPEINNSAYDKFIKQQKESIALSQREGVERAKLKALQDAIRQGAIRTDNSGAVLPGQEKQIAAIQSNAATDFNLLESQKKPRGKTAEQKTEDVYSRLIKQQKEQIALAGQNTELAKARYQISQGEFATLSEAQKQTVLQNAALIDQTKIKQQLIAYENALSDANASARAANQAQLTGYGQGSRLRERMQEEYSIRKEFEEKNTDLLRQYQAKEIDQEFYQKGIALNKQYLEQRLRDQQSYYDASDAQRGNWSAGMQEGFANWSDNASDYASQTANLVSTSMDGLVGSISDALSGNADSWDNWANSVLRSMQKIILNAMLVDSLRSASNSGLFGSLGSMFGGSAGGSTPSGAYNSAASGLQLNAKGGAYASASLSAYSNSIVSSPTYFAFAKGAGLMGEAGPEAIMPLTRSADGSLGVRVVGSQSPAAGNGITQHITQHFTISGNGDAALKQAMQEAARQGANDGAKQARQDLLQDFSNRGQARRLLGV
ncbi:phage tail tape measure protein [Salmonella enterica subsp. enterica serovar Mbandaka]|nr:phage tail tape measure protein [Salmonella enterica subsp. enterica serovar Mbandaka]